MVTQGGSSDSTLAISEIEAKLREEPYCFEFFQALRLLERLQPDRKPVGRFTNPTHEVARLLTHPSLAFPASQIQSLSWSANRDAPPRLAVNFMGLIGTQGALPHWYTSLVLQQLRSGDTALREFFDTFHHRLLSFFYQAWEKYRFAIAYERGERDVFSHHVLDLIGLGTPGLEERQAVSDDAELYFAGILGQKPRSATALELVLSEYFEVPVYVEQMLGSWFSIESCDECLLGERVTASEQLGYGAVVGDQVWDQQARARICIGPLSLAQYLDFLPDGTAFEPLRGLVRFFSGDEIDYEVQLILEREQVPRCELGAQGEVAPRLGWVTWMKSNPLSRDPQDTILHL